MQWIMLIVLLTIGNISAEEALVVDFQTINSQAVGLDGKLVKIRGFYFQGENQQSIISSEPNLKSCCIGKENKKMNQVVLDGHYDVNLINQVIEVEGLYEKEELHHLRDTKLLEPPPSFIWYYFLLGVGVLCFGIFKFKSNHKEI